MMELEQIEGNVDAYFIEGSEYSQFNATDQTWVMVGDPVDANGGTQTAAGTKQTVVADSCNRIPVL